MKKEIKCRYCGSNRHYSTFCFDRPRPRISQQGKLYYKMVEVRRDWIKANPPDQYGYWNCYLRIAPNCLPRIDKDQLTIDHVKPRSNRADLRHKFDNLLPACSFCNTLKGSRSLERLALDYPHLNNVIKELELKNENYA